jgi:putative nucleotidyltransferase with HDIG domain
MSAERLHSRLLLVDDEPGIRETLDEFLSAHGARIRVAADGHEALEILQSEAIDIVLTDRNMPGLGGQELLIEIRRHWPETDVVMMTGIASIRTAVDAMRLGAVDYIEKPVDLQATLAILERVEHNRHIRRERDQLRAEVALRELSQVITANLHMGDLPSRVAELIRRFFHTRDIAIQYRFPGSEEDALLWRSRAQSGEDSLDEGEQLLAIEAAARGDVVQRRGADRLQVCIPLLADTQPRGCILLTRAEDSIEFDLGRLDLLRIMAGHVTVALENAHLYQMATRQMRSTQKLAEIGRRLNRSLEMEETLREIHASITAFVDCDATLVVCLDRSMRRLQIDIAGRRQPTGDLLQTLLDETEQRLARLREATMSWDDRQVNLRGSGPQSLESGEIRALSWVPISDEQGGFGLLGVVKFSGREFLRRDVQNFMLLSSSASSALQNSLLFTSLRRLHFETVEVLSKAIDKKDHYTHGHSAQVGEIAVKLARVLGINSADELEEIRLGGLMHDLGKIGIRDSVLNKPGRLSAEEYDHIKTHPLVGAEILRRAPHLSRLVPFVRHHHERWDGGGYPDGLAGEEIPLKVRVLTLADTFHAMASDRIYRQSMPIERILEIIRSESGRMFDPRVVDAFFQLWTRGELGRQDIDTEPGPLAATG